MWTEISYAIYQESENLIVPVYFNPFFTPDFGQKYKLLYMYSEEYSYYLIWMTAKNS